MGGRDAIGLYLEQQQQQQQQQQQLTSCLIIYLPTSIYLLIYLFPVYLFTYLLPVYVLIYLLPVYLLPVTYLLLYLLIYLHLMAYGHTPFFPTLREFCPSDNAKNHVVGLWWYRHALYSVIVF